MDRFWSRVDLSDPAGCWLWTGSRTRDGYPRFARTVSPGVQVYVRAHRYAWELLIGPIPDGLTLDHLTDRCDSTLCVRPAHLEPVPNAENVRRRHARRRAQNGATS